jgi:large subunit ribosomal protein L7/L12
MNRVFSYFTFHMSQITNEIVEKLKTLTILEAAELVSQIEEAFGVDASVPTGRGVIMPRIAGDQANDPSRRHEKTTFDVVLESISENKRVAALKAIRRLTSLGLKEAKDFCSSLPKVVKEGVPKEEAETAKTELEEAGGKVSIR